jgi:hypothetical protein
MLRIAIILACLAYKTQVYAQFHLIGDANYMANGCIQLTPDEPYSEGIAYSNTKLNLLNNFEIEFDIFLGERDEGADGITFVIHNDERGNEAYGTWGECMGYGTWNRSRPGGNYIAPSVAVEFDTYYNGTQNDPSSDHVAYLENGSSFHSKFWNDNKDDFNMEDDLLHNFKFRWNPSSKKITVYLDGQIVYQGNRDLIKDVFNGATKVTWGFTASTGRKSNLQYFCLKRLAQSKPAPEKKLVKELHQQAQSQYAKNSEK